MSNKLRKLSRVDDNSFQERLYRGDSFSGYGHILMHPWMHGNDVQDSKASVCQSGCLEYHDSVHTDFSDIQKSPNELFGLLQTSIAKPMQQH